MHMEDHARTIKIL